MTFMNKHAPVFYPKFHSWLDLKALESLLLDKTSALELTWSLWTSVNSLPAMDSRKDEEAQTVALIKALSRKCASRILLEDFPQTEF